MTLVHGTFSYQLRTMCKEALRRVGDFLWPPLCLKCGDEVSSAHGLCGQCWSDIRFFKSPLCSICGLPLPIDDTLDQEESLLCGACAHTRPIYTKARSVVAYTPHTGPLVVSIKHRVASPSFPLLDQWIRQGMEALMLDMPPGEVLIVPVPLHWRRLMRRGYNQAARLAVFAHRHLLQQRPCTLGLRVLKKTKATSSQGALTRAQRLANLKGVFKVHPSKDTKDLSNTTVVLVDDVWTTGATIHACCTALKKAGCPRILVLTVARVV